ncbi:MAG: mechanosensitive ion channel family protein [Thermoanaerobaculia bacterium]|nr:mechanosensitive ion channel family protein [Thermoanaerobaculia bacterium]
MLADSLHTRLPLLVLSVSFGLLSVGALPASPALAQGGAGAPAAAEPVAPEDTARDETEMIVPSELANARATMRTFLEAFDPQKRPDGEHPLDRAATTLDLSAIDDDLRKTQGRELAAQLKEVIDRTVYVDFAAIPARPEGNPWSLEVPGSGDRPAGTLVIAPDETGIWRFTAGTVEQVPGMLQRIRDRETVEGVTESEPLTLAMWIRSRLSPGLLEAPFLFENWQWLVLLILGFVGIVADRLVVAAVHLTVQRYLARTQEALDPDELRKALRPVGWLVMALIWWPGLLWSGLPANTLSILVVTVKFVVIAAAVWAAYRAVDIIALVLDQRASKSANKFDDLLVPLFRKSSRIIVAALGFVFIADNLDLEITSLVAGLGIGGLALALAAQDTVKNLFGSLTVIVDRPFSIGDWVVVDDVEGTVAELGFRSTRIRTFYDSVITVPNANLINANVDNYGRRHYRRWYTTLSLTYDTRPEQIETFCEGIRELIRTHQYTRKDSFHVYLNALSTSSLDVMVYMFFDCPDWSVELQAKERLALDILRLARELGVEFAFPTRTVHLLPESKDEETDSESDTSAARVGFEEARHRARSLAAASGPTAPAKPEGHSGAD